MTPAVLPSCAWTTSTVSPAIFIARFFRVSVNGLNKYSPASATPPPIMIFSGLSKFTTLAKPIPMYSPTIVKILWATGSPAFAASHTIYGVIGAPFASYLNFVDFPPLM